MTGRETFQGGQRARELYDQGLSCNAIAKELGVGAATISRWARREGLPFDRSATELAVRARKIDIEDSRTLLTQKMLLTGHDALDNLDGPYLVYSFGGKDNTYTEHLLDTPPMEVMRVAQTIAKDAHAAATRLIEKSDTGLDEALGVVGALARGFAAAAEKLRSEPDED